MKYLFTSYATRLHAAQGYIFMKNRRNIEATHEISAAGDGTRTNPLLIVSFNIKGDRSYIKPR